MRPFKQLLLVSAVVTSMYAPAMAQSGTGTTVFKAERIKSSQLPPEVLAAYKQKYPTANLKDIVKLPMTVYKKNWQIDDAVPPDGSAEFYKLYLTGTGLSLEALYDRKGNLVRANEVAKNVVVPKKISTYIVNNYKGYLITKDQVKRFIEPNSISAEWEIQIAKGQETKRVFFNKDGNFVKEKA